MSQCKACKAQITFKLSKAGKWMPLDSKPEMRAVLTVIDGEEVVEIVKTWQPHWASCPQADRFKRQG